MKGLIGDKQNQHVSNGSTAIQVYGDINQAGLNYRDVKEIVTDLFELNFLPKIQEASKAISVQYIEDFTQKMFDRLKAENYEYIQERLKSPDVQAAISASIVHVARMTDKSHQEVLCELLVQKINETEDEENLILNNSIEVMSKITKNQILFLVFIFLLRGVIKTEIGTNGTETLCKDPMVHYKYFENDIFNIIGTTISPINIFLLSHNGLISDGLKTYVLPLTELLSQRTNIDLSGYKEDENIKSDDEFSRSFPNLSRLIIDFGFTKLKDLDRCPTTPIADRIAFAHLKNVGFLQ